MSFRILHIIDSLSVGGAERLLVSVINNLPGHEHHLICLTKSAELAAQLDKNCKLTLLNFQTKKDTLGIVREVRHYINQHKIEIVHSHLVMSNIIARLASPKSVKVFNSLHNLNGKKLFSGFPGWQRWIEKLTYKKRHHLIAVSGEVLKDYTKYIGLKGQATVLYNFVDDRFFASQALKPQLNGKLRMVAVGSFKAQKNYRFLVEAFTKIPGGISLDIYGTGPLKLAIEELIKTSSVPIRLMGLRDDIENVLPEYDLYVMSSIFEGHPVALLEAMSCGMPALVSDIPVLREATENYGIFFSLDGHEDFINKVKEIQNGQIDLAPYACHNFELANRVARKSEYLDRLLGLYAAKA